MIAMNKTKIGRFGEELAANYLQSLGYQILERNYLAKFGEIDIIAKLNDTIAFVEVKTRKNSVFGTPGQAVNYRKQSKIIKTANLYKMNCHDETVTYRFDVIEIYYDSFEKYKINHIEGAFET